MRDGQTIPLRDEFGRPEWAGRGRASLGAIWDGYGGEGWGATPGDGTGTDQAQVDEWLTLSGTVLSVDDGTLAVQTDAGEKVSVENRAWWFAQEQGFLSPGGRSRDARRILRGCGPGGGPAQQREQW